MVILKHLLFYIDEKKEMFSSTSKMNRHSTSKSNFSLTEDSAQFRATKVCVLFHLYFLLCIIYYIIVK